jgi:hypothetical protein
MHGGANEFVGCCISLTITLALLPPPGVQTGGGVVWNQHGAITINTTSSAGSSAVHGTGARGSMAHMDACCSTARWPLAGVLLSTGGATWNQVGPLAITTAGSPGYGMSMVGLAYCANVMVGWGGAF